MKKIFFVLFALLLFLTLIGCQEAPPEVSPEEEVSRGISEIDELEEDLALSELDELDASIEELES